MLLKNPSLLFKSNSFKLITFFTILFVISSLAINLYAYSVISNFIYIQSRSEIEKDILEFNEGSNGTSFTRTDSKLEEHHRGEHHERGHHGEEHRGLRAEVIRGELFEKHNNSPFFVRLISEEGENRYLKIPDDWNDLAPDFINRTISYTDDGWSYVKQGTVGKKYEIRTQQLTNGSVIQMGQRIEEREDLLSTIRRVYFLAIVPIVVLGYLGGLFIADRAMNPLKQLINTLNSIIKGSKMDIRVPEQQADKLHDELFSLFNNMLDKIEYLITSMRNVLDNVAHDIRTPMTRIMGIAELGLESDQIEVKNEALADCIEESERIQIMLKTIMDVSGAETGAMKLNQEKLDLVPLIIDIIELYSYVAEEKNITVSTNFPENLYVKADSNRLSQVIANLLDNAIKYTPSRGKIDIESSLIDKEVVISVKDTGLGIPEAELNNIWDRLYRGDKSRNERGIGLGLSLVKAIVEAHNGYVKVSSTPDAGSVFSIYLPV